MKIQQIYAKPILACWIQGFTWKEIGEMQREDKELKFIFNWLEKQEVPNEDELFLSSPATKNYWINKELFFFSNETVLWKRDENSEAKVLVVPIALKEEILSLSHDCLHLVIKDRIEPLTDVNKGFTGTTCYKMSDSLLYLVLFVIETRIQTGKPGGN